MMKSTGQYIAFCRVMDDQVKNYGRTEEAAWETIRICSDRGVLREYLAGREKEVVTIMKKLFDEEYAREIELKATAREAAEKARAEDAKGMYEDGISVDRIARIQKTTVDVIKKILGLDQEPVAFG